MFRSSRLCYKDTMGLQDCQIILDNTWNTYYAAQTVNGQVKLQLNSIKNIRGKFYLSTNWIHLFYNIFIRVYLQI